MLLIMGLVVFLCFHNFPTDQAPLCLLFILLSGWARARLILLASLAVLLQIGLDTE